MLWVATSEVDKSTLRGISLYFGGRQVEQHLLCCLDMFSASNFGDAGTDAY